MLATPIPIARTTRALAALVLAVLVSACGGATSRHGGAAAAPSPAVVRAPLMGVTAVMPPDDPVDGAEFVVASPWARSIVAAEDRAPSDRALDRERRPAELLTFLRVQPGMRVAVLIAGTGYTTELLARAVGPTGVVYAENPALTRASVGRAWASRLATPAMRPVVQVGRELDAPLPPEAKDLDLVVINLVYHDAIRLGVDRGRMNRAVYAALRSGGKYVVVDHSARSGDGFGQAGTLHRVEPWAVSREVEDAGLQFERWSDFLRNDADTRDWNASPELTRERGDTSDRFALMFVKP